MENSTSQRKPLGESQTLTTTPFAPRLRECVGSSSFRQTIASTCIDGMMSFPLGIVAALNSLVALLSWHLITSGMPAAMNAISRFITASYENGMGPELGTILCPFNKLSLRWVDKLSLPPITGSMETFPINYEFVVNFLLEMAQGLSLDQLVQMLLRERLQSPKTSVAAVVIWLMEKTEPRSSNGWSPEAAEPGDKRFLYAVAGVANSSADALQQPSRFPDHLARIPAGRRNCWEEEALLEELPRRESRVYFATWTRIPKN